LIHFYKRDVGNMEEVVRIRKALESLIETPEEIAAEAPAHIEELDNMKMNLKILQKSKIGFTLNFLRKATSDESVKKSAKVLIKKWQSLEEKETNPSSGGKTKTESFKENSAKPSPGKKAKTGQLTQAAFEVTAPPPSRNKKGELEFEDEPDFKPNLTPKQVLQMGSFGGTYFRPIYSSVTKQKYGSEVWEELPKDWLEGLDVRTKVASSIYDTSRNKYGVKCGASLEEWESSGWMHRQDPYGWFQWYCRFYQGRRTEDDSRQVGRWARCAGQKGRWKNNLISKIVKAGSSWDNVSISPVVRQTLQHWAYQLSQDDFNKNYKRFKK